MKRTVTYLSLSLLAIGGAFAAPLSPQEALQRLKGTPGDAVFEVGTRSADIQIRPKITLKDPSGQPTLYVFNQEADQGFLVVSADDAAPALLGYSDSGSFELNNMPPALDFWLKEYQRQIEYVRENSVGTRANNSEMGVQLPVWEPIPPKLSTTWDQVAPYNDLCPNLTTSYRCPTGCVATSVSQVMKFFNYPEKGQGSISYKPQSINTTLRMDFGATTFDWANMLDDYSGTYTEDQALAVATLMKAVGYSLQMEYAAESGTVSAMIPNSLVKYFNYDKGIEYRLRAMYTYSEWAKMLYDNIKNVSPVVYDGTGDGGHSFVFDGYQNNGYFHVNWGWGGVANGYYLIDALEPTVLGVGAGQGTYNFDQGAVFGMQPPTSSNTPSDNIIIQYGSVVGSTSSTNIKLSLDYNTKFLGWGYEGVSDQVTFTLGAGFQNLSNPSDISYFSSGNPYNQQLNLKPELLTPLSGRTSAGESVDLAPYFNFSTLKLADGKYKVFSAFKIAGQDWKEIKCDIGMYNYVYLTKSGNTYTVENFSPMVFTGGKFELLTGFYYSRPFQVNVEIKNPNNTELTRNLAMVLLNSSGKIAYQSETFTMTLPANGTITQTWETSLSRISGSSVNTDTDFYPGLYDYKLGLLVYTSTTPLTMHPNPGSAQVESVTLEVVGAESNVLGPQVTYYVSDPSNISVASTLAIKSGYFSNYVDLGIYSKVGATNIWRNTESYPLGMYFLSANESKTSVTEFSLPNATVGQSYGLGLLSSGSTLATRNTYIEIVAGDAGVDSMVVGEGIEFFYDSASKTLNAVGAVSLEAYYLNGMKAPLNVEYTGENAYADLSSLGKGVIVVTATDLTGHRKSAKLAL